MNQQWKIKRDFFYSDLYDQFGFDFIEEAGFFYDTDLVDRNLDNSLDLLCTPLGFDAVLAEKSCVLLTTGSFCPIHYGHVQMMEGARQELEKEGWKVLKGYIAPAHDEYIKKKCGAGWMNIDKRIQLIQKQIEGSDWLVVDPWEGVFNKVAVNFTDVIARLAAYIQKHLQRNVPVFYICGSDNARFANTFLLKGHCVVVKRPGYEAEFERYKNLASNRILFIDGDASVSSTELRQQLSIESKKIPLDLITQNHPMEARLITVLSSYYFSVNSLLLDSFQVPLDAGISSISLDGVIAANYSLSISRLYELGGMQFKQFVNRPGSREISRQLELLPDGECQLWDTDTFSGKTLEFITRLLERHNITPTSIHTLLGKIDNEILDARDFFLDARDAGLVIQLPNGQITRAPYIYPYVNPAIRCSLEEALHFSIAIWKMNRDYFGKRDDKLSQLVTNKALFLYQGFSEQDFLADIANWHYQKLLAYCADA